MTINCKTFYTLRTGRPLILKFGMIPSGIELYKVSLNYDNVVPLTYLTATLTWFASGLNVENW